MVQKDMGRMALLQVSRTRTNSGFCCWPLGLLLNKSAVPIMTCGRVLMAVRRATTGIRKKDILSQGLPGDVVES